MFLAVWLRVKMLIKYQNKIHEGIISLINYHRQLRSDWQLEILLISDRSGSESTTWGILRFGFWIAEHNHSGCPTNEVDSLATRHYRLKYQYFYYSIIQKATIFEVNLVRGYQSHRYGGDCSYCLSV